MQFKSNPKASEGASYLKHLGKKQQLRPQRDTTGTTVGFSVARNKKQIQVPKVRGHLL